MLCFLIPYSPAKIIIAQEDIFDDSRQALHLLPFSRIRDRSACLCWRRQQYQPLAYREMICISLYSRPRINVTNRVYHYPTSGKSPNSHPIIDTELVPASLLARFLTWRSSQSLGVCQQPSHSLPEILIKLDTRSDVGHGELEVVWYPGTRIYVRLDAPLS